MQHTHGVPWAQTPGRRTGGRCGVDGKGWTGTRPRWEGLALTAFSSMRLTSFTCVSVSPEFKREFSRN